MPPVRIYRWPRGAPFTFARGGPAVALVILEEWWPLPAAAGALWAARLLPLAAVAAATTLVFMIAAEEYAHLAAVARLCPEARLALTVRPPLRVRAQAAATLDPDATAAAALAGPLAALAAGLLIVFVPLGAVALLRRGPRLSYAAGALPLLPPLYVLFSAVPLPGSDAAAVLSALRPGGAARQVLEPAPAFGVSLRRFAGCVRRAAALVAAAFALRSP